jgi:hypothetical protein
VKGTMSNPDPTKPIRRELCAMINGNPQTREAIEAHFGQAWDTAELSKEFEVIGFASPLVVVRRKSDGAKGSLFFQVDPRFFFYWEEYLPEIKEAAA